MVVVLMEHLSNKFLVLVSGTSFHLILFGAAHKAMQLVVDT